MITSREKQIYKVTAVGSVVNVVLTVFKFVAGILGRSSAMVADAVHSLSDLVTDAIIFIFVRAASKPVDRSHEYGHGKFETMATLIVGSILIAVGNHCDENGFVFLDFRLEIVECLTQSVVERCAAARVVVFVGKFTRLGRRS